MAASGASGSAASSSSTDNVKTEGTDPGSDIGKKPEINVEQATRELNSLSRKILAVEEKIRAGREEV